MARTKKTTAKAKRSKRKITTKSYISERKKLFRWGESYTSLLLGIVVVIIGALFIGSLVKVRHIEQTSSISAIPLPTETQLKQPQTNLQGRAGSYTVLGGESLWTISVKFYNSGYNWVDIAKANNLANPDDIHVGNVLIIPKITPSLIQPPTLTPVATGQIPSAIKTNAYVVQKGDSLWDIAVRSYADGYKWVDIARANNLGNPDLIFSGNILKIPR